MTDALTLLSTHLADAVERVAGALVRVHGRARYPSTGLVHAPDLVVAADHALERDDDLSVDTPDGRTLLAELAGRDPATDLALLRVAGLGLEAAPAAPAPPRIGQLVLAVGRAGAEGPAASLGVVSAVGGPLRSGRGALLDRYIRTDATPYPGFSGGPLIDGTGAVVGILTTGLVRGVALAIPTELARRVVDTLAAQGHVPRAYLGIGSQPVHLPEGQRGPGGPERGLLIVSIGPDTPAARGGLLLGDILIFVGGQAVEDVDQLQAALATAGVGATLSLEVVRGGSRTTLGVTVGQRRP